MTNKKNADGRILRGERNRQALLDAACALVQEGNLAPTAQEVAQRAGVGLRGLFRHFGDMEGLRAAFDEQMNKEGESQFVGGSCEGSLKERLLRVVEQRAAGYEAYSNIFLSVQIQRWSSQVLCENYKRDNYRLRKDLECWLPELKSLSAHRREAVDSAASFETWYRLREHQHQSVEAAVNIIYDIIKGLMEVA